MAAGARMSDSERLKKWRGAAISLGIILLVAAAFRRVLDAGFITLDDAAYVYENPHVLNGLSPRSAAWAFTTFREANWHPLTWLSHLLDVSLFGLNPVGHHLVNLVLHAAGAVSLFLLLRGLTGALWRSAAVAAIFAVHPLRVESVAWVAERKDVLCILLGFLTMSAYLGYLRRPGRGRYLAILGLFALGLMAKPMLVTLPFVLLLLDGWPLRRWPRAAAGWIRLLREKAPLLALSAASSAVTLAAQISGGSIRMTMKVPMAARLSNALVSWGTYVVRTVRPADLSVYYGYSLRIPPWKVILAAIFLAGATLLVLRAYRSRPYLCLGWFWYLGVLVPVIGFVQVGGQRMADRYTYLPQVGLLIMAVWGGADLAGRRLRARLALGAAVVASLAILVLLTLHQTGYWRDDIGLYRHALEVEPDHFLIRHNLGCALARDGWLDAASEQYRLALRLNPAYPPSHNNLGAILGEKGRPDEALPHFARALELKPDYFDAQVNMGIALEKLGRIEEAAARYREALRLDPGSDYARSRLERLLGRPGQ